MPIPTATGTRARAATALAALALAAALLPPSAAHADTPATAVLFQDDFQQGFSDSGADARWDTPPAPGLTTTDGIATTAGDGLTVVPSGTDPSTGRPAFRSTTAQQSAGGQGLLDHGKFAARTTHLASSGLGGFDTPASGSLSCSVTMSATTTGTERQPFGTAVTDPQSDPRLGSGAMVFADPESAMILDFFVTNKKVYAIYERLRMPGTTYAAYSYAVPVADRADSTQTDTLKISVNRAGSATWYVGGKSVLTVARIGYRSLDRAYMTLDHGGTEEAVHPRQLNCGFNTFTLLDGAFGGQKKGLVRLDSTAGFYYAPDQGPPAAQTFLDESGAASNRLWGQGVTLKVRQIQITSG